MTYPNLNDPVLFNNPLFTHKPMLKKVTIWLPIVTPIAASLVSFGLGVFALKHPEIAALMRQTGLMDNLQKLPMTISGGVVLTILGEQFVAGKKAEATGRQAAAVAVNTPSVTVTESTSVPPVPPSTTETLVTTTTSQPAATPVVTGETD